MTLSPNVLAPDEPINITIEGIPEQRVCINIADESVDINQLSKMTSDKIFQMLGDLEDGEQGQEWWQLSHGSISTRSLRHEQIPKIGLHYVLGYESERECPSNSDRNL